MTKVESLLKNNPYLKLSLIDVIKLLDPSGKSKYVELIHKFGPKNRIVNTKPESDDIRRALNEVYGIPIDSLSEYTDKECGLMYYLIDRYFNSSELKLIRKLHDLVSNNLVDNFDISKINSYDDVANFITLAEIKKNDKESEKMCKILLRNDNWLVLRPLSHKASLKYGASTKWCTSSENDPNYFLKYCKRGILIYIINMKTGNKTAFFHLTQNEYDETETSFWDLVDRRVDSIQTDLTGEVLDIIKNEMKEKVSNWDLLTDSQKEKLESEVYGQKSAKLFSLGGVLSEISEMAQPVDIPVSEAREVDIYYRPDRVAEEINIAVNVAPTMRG